MGMKLNPYGDKFGYVHSGINNSSMFYVGPNGLIVTGTLNWYNGRDTDTKQYYAVKDMLSCIATNGDDWLHDCPGGENDHYFAPLEQCKRACNVWKWAGWPYATCSAQCSTSAAKGGDAVWDDQYVTCLERNKDCLGSRGKTNIVNDKCEWETGCPSQCLNSPKNWWDCIPQCEGTTLKNSLRETQSFV